MHVRSASALAAVLLVVLGTGVGFGHEGHDHGPQAALAPANMAPRGEASSPDFELVAVARGAELLIYLDRFATNEPIEGAIVEVETPAGSQSATPDGAVYRLKAPWLDKPGHIDLIVTVTAGGSVDVLPLSLDIPEQAAATPEPRSWQFAGWQVPPSLRALVQPAILAAAAVGFALGIVLMAFGRRRRPIVVALLLGWALAMPAVDAIAHDGHSHDATAAPANGGGERAVRQNDGAVFVPKPIQRIFGLRTASVENGSYPRTVELPGRIIPDPNASGYVQPAVGGRLSAPAGGFPRMGTPVRQGDVLAYVTAPLQAIDISDMRQRQGELDQQIAITERRLARYEQLAPSGAVARFQLEETKLELDGLRDRRASLDRARREPEALVAPVGGVIADGTPIAGQIAQSNAVVFHIVDPARLWVEALSFEAMTGVRNASVVTANGRPLSLVFRGSGLTDRNQSIPVHFAIEGDANGLRAGQFVTVFVQTDDHKRGLALPRSALVRSAGGQDIVYEHVGAERFEPRPVRAEPLDGERVLIAAGLEPGKRIVVQGAELLDHVR